MPGFEGTWSIEYHQVVGENPLMGDTIQITYVSQSFYHLSISQPDAEPWEFTTSPGMDGMSFSMIEGGVASSRGVKIVFDSATNPQKIIAGPLGSQIEVWSGVPQPSDMGTFTGTKG